MEPNPGYAAVAVYLAGKDHPTLLNVDGKVVVFDTPLMAQWAIPRFGGGRTERWSADGETAFFEPLVREGINRAVIVTQYDLYNLPPNHPVPSEAKGRDWKHHVHWYEVIKTVTQQLDQGADNAIATPYRAA